MANKTPKNESVLAFLTTILKKSVDASSSDFGVLATSVKVLAEEMQHLSRAVALLTATLQKHNDAIVDLYSVQEFVLKHMKPTESKLPPLHKDKSQKPN